MDARDIPDEPSISTRPFSEHGVFIEIGGEVDYGSATELRGAVARAVARGHRHIVVDLSSAALIDCACIGAILSEVEPLRSQPDAVLIFAGAHGVVDRMLGVLDFGQVCDVVGTPEAAVELAIDPRRAVAQGWRRSPRPGALPVESATRPSTANGDRA
jgi:anti-anti-sigma factor